MTPRAWAALAAVYVIWGSTYLGIKVAGDTIPAFSAVSARFILAGALMAAIVAWRQGRHALRITRRELACAALIGLLLPGANGLLFVSERTVPTGVASLIIASVPLLVVLLRLAGGERPPRLAIVGVLVGFVGVAILFRPEGGATWWGIALTAVSAVAWATGSYLSSRIPLPRDAFVATTFEMLAGGLIFLPIGIAQRPDLGAVSGTSLLAFAYLVLIGSLIGFTAYVWLLHHAPLGTVATYAYVNPPVALVVGWWLGNESFSPNVLIGLPIVLGAVGLLGWVQYRASAARGDNFNTRYISSSCREPDPPDNGERSLRSSHAQRR